MAPPLARVSAIDLAEEAVATLRAAPLAALLYHWIGSVPFALALLIFWNDITSPGATDATCAADGFALALLLAWMNCWRAVCAGQIRRQLAREAHPRWNLRRIWRLVVSQVFIGGTKLVVFPLAVTITLPMPATVAFYRTAAVLSDREDLDLWQILGRARKLAAPDQRQGWEMLCLLSILYLVLAFNIAILLALLPQLVRVLTGYESAFSRGEAYFIGNSLFWVTTLMLAWIVFDPFIQAVYCVRYFKLESRETGADLRAALRRILALAAAAQSVLWGFATPAVQLAPANLDRAIRQTLQSSDYSWQATPAPHRTTGASWLVAATDRLVDQGKAALHSVGDVLVRLVDWIREKLHAPAATTPAAAPVTALQWSIYVLIALMLALAVTVAWRMRRARHPKKTQSPADSGAAVNLRDENLLANQLPEDRWMALAEDCERQGDLRSAVRATYLANLAWLGRGEWIAIHPGKTNREYELEARRKMRSSPAASSLFAANIVSFESAWYGMHEVTAGDLESLRGRLRKMKAGA